VVALLACLAVWLAPAPAQRAATPAPYATTTAMSDTLRYSTRAGQAFIAALPARVGSAEATYRVTSAPALSWLVDRSFFWNVQAGESGTLPVVFERRTAGGGTDTLVLLVEITR
jgi:hypothetical protein